MLNPGIPAEVLLALSRNNQLSFADTQLLVKSAKSQANEIIVKDLFAFSDAFVDYFLSCLHDPQKRSILPDLFAEFSCFSFNGEKYQGKVSIFQQLEPMRLIHSVESRDSQKTEHGIMIFLKGRLRETRSSSFVYLFHLVPLVEKPNSYLISNLIFRHFAEDSMAIDEQNQTSKGF